MKIYLAGPMRGFRDFNFPEFRKHADYLRQQGHEVFNPADLGLPQDDIRTIFAVEMNWLCREAECIYLMPGWQHSRGARAEAALAEALDLKVIRMDYQPPPPPERLSQSELEFSTTSHWHLLKSLKFPSPDKSSMELQAGTGLSLETSQMLLFAIFLSVALAIPMGFLTLLKWLGVR